ncbi:GlxA family transcriptional regulator [Amycolatopsis acidiphila]|uniref:GlxA family transcriptional regulator n=1 Tax=Amycolatopsis acidiphila TaxID=715473 RepID=A0A558ALU2_9PSEU|nr:GlxA family transcriptional regulator [Amycolatopsis acidiphila]TVT25236.1 GlxA family transcriptional regulator [Amycolatopsis acidiphila]UIJ62352.1 GlxA family transcriptional regulator [Amycolatopsis acidiphila]GHG83204.1 AraC family transcriptional regulator [Amycolatopsis acidiphila]
MPVHQVLIPIFHGVQPLDVTGPYEALMGATQLLGRSRAYTVSLVAAGSEFVTAESGLKLVPDGPLPASGAIGTLLVPGGLGARDMRPDDPVVEWLRRAAPRSARVVSVCTGAFPLAAAGLLDGLSATTHWRHAPRLAARYPNVDVRADPIYLRQGRVWTAAGVTAGIDLALALVEADHGVEVAQHIARELVVFLRRPGGQSQFAGPVWTDPARKPAIRVAQDLIHASPEADLRVPALAAHAGMSERHFSREFARSLGCPPGDYVERVRVDAARRLLESEPVPVPVVATRCGFGTAETMRRAFLRRLGVPPDHYRRHFAALS